MGEPKKTPDDDKSKGGDKTFTQKDLDDKIEERLKRERAKYADYDELKAKAEAADQKADGDKSESEKLAEQLESVKKDLADETAKRLRAEVAAAKGLTPAQAKRLTGSTLEELEADADDLLEAFPAPKEGGKKDDDSKGSKPPGRQVDADLKGGNDPTEDVEELDPAKLADAVPRP